MKLYKGGSVHGALLHNSGLRQGSPFPGQHQATRTISAVPRAEKRFICSASISLSGVLPHLGMFLSGVLLPHLICSPDRRELVTLARPVLECR